MGPVLLTGREDARAPLQPRAPGQLALLAQAPMQPLPQISRAPKRGAQMWRNTRALGLALL
eukprot:684512-Pyramimonas_sp.AAC.1